MINILLYQKLAFTEKYKKRRKNIKRSYKNNEFKMSASTWNEDFELPDGSYSVSDIQDYFKYILKNMEKRMIILQ